MEMEPETGKFIMYYYAKMQSSFEMVVAWRPLNKEQPVRKEITIAPYDVHILAGCHYNEVSKWSYFNE